MQTNYVTILREALIKRGIFHTEGIDSIMKRHVGLINEGIFKIFEVEYPISERCSFINFDQFIENLLIEDKSNDYYVSQKGMRRLLEIFKAMGASGYNINTKKSEYTMAVFCPDVFKNANKRQFPLFEDGTLLNAVGITMSSVRGAISMTGVGPSTYISVASQIRCALNASGLGFIAKWQSDDMLYIPTRVVETLIKRIR